MPLVSKIFAAVCTAALLCGCSHGGDSSLPADAVAVVGKDVLRQADVVRNIPAGTSHDDSTALAKAYIRQWIDGRLIESVATENVDMEEIDRLTRDYRSQLIMAHYRRAMAAQAQADFPEDSLKAYYEAHKADYKLERPLLKGVYLKVPADAKNLRTIRQLYRSERPTDIDRLEKAALGTAIHYDYFRDSWVDWEQIETRIPLDFTGENFNKVSRKQPIDFASQGFVYLLSVSDFLPKGSAMPYEAARPLVKERMLAQRRRAYDRQLVQDLYDHALEDGTLRFP